MKTNLPTPTTARVYVNLPEGNSNWLGLASYKPSGRVVYQGMTLFDFSELLSENREPVIRCY
jgi:hypothetical protein